MKNTAVINVCNRQLDVLLLESRSYFKVKSFSFLPKVGFQPVKGNSHRLQALYLWAIKVFCVLIIIQKQLNHSLMRKAPLIALPQPPILCELWDHESIDCKLMTGMRLFRQMQKTFLWCAVGFLSGAPECGYKASSSSASLYPGHLFHQCGGVWLDAAGMEALLRLLMGCCIRARWNSGSKRWWETTSLRKVHFFCQDTACRTLW